MRFPFRKNKIVIENNKIEALCPHFVVPMGMMLNLFGQQSIDWDDISIEDDNKMYLLGYAFASGARWKVSHPHWNEFKSTKAWKKGFADGEGDRLAKTTITHSP